MSHRFISNMTFSAVHRLSPVLIAALLLTTLAVSSSVQAQSLTLRQVTERLQESRQDIDDIQAKADFNFRLSVGIIPYSDSLHGSYFFKKPDRHRFDFPDAPSYLRNLPSMFSWKMPKAEKYDCKVVGPIELRETRVYRLLFSSKNAASKTESITVLVDTRNWTVIAQDTLYRDGGSVLLSFSYSDQDHRILLEKVSGKLDIRNFKLTGTAAITLSEQQVNLGVDEATFDKEL